MYLDRFLIGGLFVILLSGCTSQEAVQKDTWYSIWPIDTTEFVGAEYAAFPHDGWQVSQGRLQSRAAGADHEVEVLGVSLSPEAGEFEVSVILQVMIPDSLRSETDWVGLRIGGPSRLDGPWPEIPVVAGLDIGVTTFGEMFVGDPATADALSPLDFASPIKMTLSFTLTETSNRLKLHLSDPLTGKFLEDWETTNIHPDKIAGSIYLVSHFSERAQDLSTPLCWFSDLTVSGKRADRHPDRSYGPILYHRHYRSGNTLHVKAEAVPITAEAGEFAYLEIESDTGWTRLQERQLTPANRLIHFEIPNWLPTHTAPYRIGYEFPDRAGRRRVWQVSGHIPVAPSGTEVWDLMAVQGGLKPEYESSLFSLPAQRPHVLLIQDSVRPARMGRAWQTWMSEIPTIWLQEDAGDHAFGGLDLAVMPEAGTDLGQWASHPAPLKILAHSQPQLSADQLEQVGKVLAFELDMTANDVAAERFEMEHYRLAVGPAHDMHVVGDREFNSAWLSIDPIGRRITYRWQEDAGKVAQLGHAFSAIFLNQLDNLGEQDTWKWLPGLEATDSAPLWVEVISEQTGQLVYAIQVDSPSQPFPVPTDALHRLNITHLPTGCKWMVPHLTPDPTPSIGVRVSQDKWQTRFEAGSGSSMR
ncbi:hypothetical protein [Pontibacter sp. G13]|uniref:hypothetical protein n=1 Tax=Pontibacter sp. G13 TaxID=3074898 RepID=UPI002889C8F3|nr:hypothetical protein [Pontibacter sp. G13]WNJ20000.1 hypothetical protein RJD25_05910 [Pontibacter sp. G13]